ncbi:hypothetical protein ILUMI_13154 [Ignelater luminosus]|uniref:Lymphocyte expansion molecule n=1 Tax=Ignelater luminosus TaxID=2038154 RepID=A0A8K0CV10_IGNLU|nr:hypothetical protein ILUMI_13154 [Ignelater luminosus]
MTRKAKFKSFKTKAPFGVATKRFEGMGFHPNLDTTGCMQKTKLKLGPGYYNPERFECPYKKYNVGGSSWKRKADIEEFSQNLGFRNTHILKERKFRKSLGGPGFYDISDELLKKQTSSCLCNVGFGKQRRFWDPLENNNPPPGTYGKDITKHSTMGRKQFSKIPTFEMDGFVDRFKDKNPSYTKPPNLYNPVDFGSINALLMKKVSKRGPYDLFTGRRDGSTIKNHFSPPAFKGLDWFHTYPNELDILLNHPAKQRIGKFLQEARFGKATLRHMIDDLTFCYHDPDEPSPCHYEVDTVREFKKSMYPFNTSTKDARPSVKWTIHPGVGRYNPKHSLCAKPKQESWMFRSKCGRTEYKSVEYNSF